MQIIGFNFTKVQGSKELLPKEKIKVSYNITISDIEKQEIELLKNENVLKFSFKYSIDYNPKFASVSFEGFILAIVEEEMQKEILKEWKKKKLVDSVKIFLFNLVLTKCSIKALQIEEDLALPSHIPMPKLSLTQKDKAEYTG